MTKLLSLALMILCFAAPAMAQEAKPVGRAGRFSEGRPACAFDQMKGQYPDEIDRSLFGKRPVRILNPGDVTTMDFSPERINLILDDEGRISEVACR